MLLHSCHERAINLTKSLETFLEVTERELRVLVSLVTRENAVVPNGVKVSDESGTNKSITLRTVIERRPASVITVGKARKLELISSDSNVDVVIVESDIEGDGPILGELAAEGDIFVGENSTVVHANGLIELVDVGLGDCDARSASVENGGHAVCLDLVALVLALVGCEAVQTGSPDVEVAIVGADLEGHQVTLDVLVLTRSSESEKAVARLSVGVIAVGDRVVNAELGLIDELLSHHGRENGGGVSIGDAVESKTHETSGRERGPVARVGSNEL
jgi:hypothetical protein